MMKDLTPELRGRKQAAWGVYKSIKDVVKKTKKTRLSGDGGLDVLNTLDGLVVKQRVEMIEVLTTIDTNNKYDVYAPAGGLIGRVYQTCGTMLRFDICDSSGRIARIVGPSFLGMGCCTCCFPNKVFKIYADDGTEIGTITKKFGGFFKELLTNADVFHVEFPVDLSVEGKSLLLSTVFLILFSAYERSPCLLRFAFGRQHALTLHVVDNDGQVSFCRKVESFLPYPMLLLDSVP
ncbi:Scramblase [Ancylostoma ceylanicum]|uniref:Phospholipid scramblase n=1 Tax=Ancylostoma ceylanicum TaxID=53326 RepID=A0A0D6LRL1_9BILA|nr:Scramblase [Ancylostoma ceylanicum]